MCVFKTLLCLLALVATALPASSARDNDAVLGKVTAEIRRREPAMRLNTQTRALFGGRGGIVESNKTEPEVTFQFWEGEGGESVSVALFMGRTREQATEGYRKSKAHGPMSSMTWTVLDTKVEGIGEEAHAWRRNHSSEVGVSFRKGRFTADVGAFSLEAAQRFASYTACALPNR